MHDGWDPKAYLPSPSTCITDKDEKSCFSHGLKESSNAATSRENRYTARIEPSPRSCKRVQNWGRTIQESSFDGPPIRKIRILQWTGKALYCRKPIAIVVKIMKKENSIKGTNWESTSYNPLYCSCNHKRYFKPSQNFVFRNPELPLHRRLFSNQQYDSCIYHGTSISYDAYRQCWWSDLNRIVEPHSQRAISLLQFSSSWICKNKKG